MRSNTPSMRNCYLCWVKYVVSSTHTYATIVQSLDGFEWNLGQLWNEIFCIPIDEKPRNLYIIAQITAHLHRQIVETGNKFVHLRRLLPRAFTRISQTALNSVKKYIIYIKFSHKEKKYNTGIGRRNMLIVLS